MQFRDLYAQYERLKPEIDEGIADVIKNHAFILGPQVAQLEQMLAEYVGVKHCVSCANGTDALIMPLMAWGIGKGDAVFAPDFTYFATVNCAMLRGATPVLVDINPKTFNMDAEALEAAIQRTLKEGRLKPAVIIPVDLFGQCADYARICEIARKYGLKLLEDGAQGFGGTINGKRACSFGNVGATSFFPVKPLGCYGDGGAMFTDCDETAQLLRSIRAQGHSPADKYDNIRNGVNSRLDTIQAAVLIPKLKAFDWELERVNEVAALYTELLQSACETPVVPRGYVSSWAQYTIKLESREQRDGLKEFLKSNDVPTMIYYPRAMHEQGAIKAGGCAAGEFPNAQRCTEVSLSLPLFPDMNHDDVRKVAALVREYLNK